MTAITENTAIGSGLGKQSTYDSIYDANKLYSIPRAGKREEIGVNPEALSFFGFDVWNHYEVSWLNAKGKPMVATAEISYDCSSPSIIESKSLKLYFNSLNNTQFDSAAKLESIIKTDLEARIQAPVTVNLKLINEQSAPQIQTGFTGECIDAVDIDCSVYTVEPAFLETTEETVKEVLYSDLLKSNCLVTGQPDWGSVLISYEGNKINREGLLRYIVSFRNHNEFHEQCIERIFMDIMRQCQPQSLTVYGRYTRRGGIDINPYRSTEKVDLQDLNLRLIRQ